MQTKYKIYILHFDGHEEVLETVYNLRDAEHAVHHYSKEHTDVKYEEIK